MAEENKLIPVSMAEMLGVPLFATDLYIPGYRTGEIGNWKIVNSNALEWTSNGKVDFLYADIWLSLDEPETLEQVRRMNGNLKADAIYFWGQEIAIYAGIEKRQGKNVSIDAASVKRCVEEEIGLPLLVPSDINYAGLIKGVAKNRLERNLSMGRMLKR